MTKPELWRFGSIVIRPRYIGFQESEFRIALLPRRRALVHSVEEQPCRWRGLHPLCPHRWRYPHRRLAEVGT